MKSFVRSVRSKSPFQRLAPPGKLASETDKVYIEQQQEEQDQCIELISQQQEQHHRHQQQKKQKQKNARRKQELKLKQKQKRQQKQEADKDEQQKENQENVYHYFYKQKHKSEKNTSVISVKPRHDEDELFFQQHRVSVTCGDARPRAATVSTMQHPGAYSSKDHNSLGGTTSKQISAEIEVILDGSTVDISSNAPQALYYDQRQSLLQPLPRSRRREIDLPDLVAASSESTDKPSPYVTSQKLLERRQWQQQEQYSQSNHQQLQLHAQYQQHRQGKLHQQDLQHELLYQNTQPQQFLKDEQQLHHQHYTDVIQRRKTIRDRFMKPQLITEGSQQEQILKRNDCHRGRQPFRTIFTDKPRQQKIFCPRGHKNPRVLQYIELGAQSRVSELSIPAAFDRTESMGIDSIANIRDKLHAMELQLQCAEVQGRKVSRDKIMHALARVADSLEKEDERDAFHKELDAWVDGSVIGSDLQASFGSCFRGDQYPMVAQQPAALPKKPASLFSKGSWEEDNSTSTVSTDSETYLTSKKTEGEVGPTLQDSFWGRLGKFFNISDEDRNAVRLAVDDLLLAAFIDSRKNNRNIISGIEHSNNIGHSAPAFSRKPFQRNSTLDSGSSSSESDESNESLEFDPYPCALTSGNKEPKEDLVAAYQRSWWKRRCSETEAQNLAKEQRIETPPESPIRRSHSSAVPNTRRDCSPASSRSPSPLPVKKDASGHSVPSGLALSSIGSSCYKDGSIPKNFPPVNSRKALDVYDKSFPRSNSDTSGDLSQILANEEEEVTSNDVTDVRGTTTSGLVKRQQRETAQPYSFRQRNHRSYTSRHLKHDSHFAD